MRPDSCCGSWRFRVGLLVGERDTTIHTKLFSSGEWHIWTAGALIERVSKQAESDRSDPDSQEERCSKPLTRLIQFVRSNGSGRNKDPAEKK